MDERKIPMFTLSPFVRSREYHALVFSAVIFQDTTSVEIAKETEGFVRKLIDTDFAVPLPMGIYCFTAKATRDLFIRKCNSLSEMESAIAVSVKQLQKM